MKTFAAIFSTFLVSAVCVDGAMHTDSKAAKMAKNGSSKSSKGTKMKDLYGCTPEKMAYFHHWVSAFYALQADATYELTLANLKDGVFDLTGPKVKAYWDFNNEHLHPEFTFTIDNFVYNYGFNHTVFVPGKPNSVNYDSRQTYLYGNDPLPDGTPTGLPAWFLFVSGGGNIMQNNNGLVTYPMCDHETGNVIVKSRAVDFSQGFADTNNNTFLESNIGLAWGSEFKFEPDENDEYVCVSYDGLSSGYATVEYTNNLVL